MANSSYSRFINGFQITSDASIDKRIILTKAEMLNVSKGKTYLVPEIYFALCAEDKKFYIYCLEDKIGWDETTGNYHPIEDYINLVGDEKAKANLEAALKASDTVSDINDLIIAEDPETGATYSRIAALETEVDTLKMDGGEISEEATE